MRRMRSADIASLVLFLLMCVVAAWQYPALPDPVPTHWNLAGEADGFTPKPWGVLVYPVILLVIWGIFKLIPVISPKGFRLDSFMPVVRVIQLAMMGCFTVVGIAALTAPGGGVNVGLIITVSMGLLLIIIGNYLGKVRRNFFIGVRTPWTLASEEVWYRTHRLAGYLFVGAGVLMTFGAVGELGFWIAFGAVLVAALFPVLYSLWLYRRIEGFGPER